MNNIKSFEIDKLKQVTSSALELPADFKFLVEHYYEQKDKIQTSRIMKGF